MSRDAKSSSRAVLFLLFYSAHFVELLDSKP